MGGAFTNKKVLITGANGFIGSHLVRRMISENAEVHIIVREGSDVWRIEDLIKDIIIYRADTRDSKKINICINKVKPDYVFNMAAYGVDSRQKDYFIAANTNIIGTMNILNSLISVGCKKFLNIGTCMEYGDKKEVIKEDCHLEPFNIYGSTKAAATMLSHQIAGENDIDIVTLRAFGVFGENEGSHKFFPHIILSILNNADVNLTGCEQYRDYCYIENIIDGFVLAAENDAIKNEIFNIGTGRIHPLKYYVDKVCAKMKAIKKPNYGVIPYRTGEVWKPHPDISKIEKLLKWTPKIAFEEGLDRTIQWYERNKHKYK
ncbi:NAD-dependent epimerase/dehydratase family protein [Natronincola ferrireducens]|uniref:Nucleoside-diphosphate-sugar epimerase n=1 Tax=Natronincola ferrireducens TaxID=393762 RepID=A0A1G9CRY3_9FIRM|nr:NAD-dependent epimerase/dehydratase family protein [Natronincola ferrireducens]SDK54174.1 Nucleoside-diphosphate-sugar epimerase [Natronincola ferrireducens]